MKKTLAIIAACALVTPGVALAQYGVKDTETVQVTPELTKAGAIVADYQPGRSLRLQEGTNDLRLRKEGAISSEFKTPGTIKIFDKEGDVVAPSELKSGTRVHVYYTGSGDNKVVQKVVVDQNIK